jgi:hypothetical protein
MASDDLPQIIHQISQQLLEQIEGQIIARAIPEGTARINIGCVNIVIVQQELKEVNVTKEGDKFTLHGDNAGAFGKNIKGNTFTTAKATSENIDIKELTRVLAELRKELKEKSEPDNLDHEAAVGAVAQAEKAAREGNSSKALEYLKGAGAWALDVAKATASGLLKDVIKGQLGGGSGN